MFTKHCLICRCDRCSYKTYLPFQMNKHKSFHDRFKKCDFCSEDFGNPKILEAHINKFHKNEKPHQCTFCDSRFYSSIKLNKHLLVEHNQKPLRPKKKPKNSDIVDEIVNCKQCGEQFPNRPAFNKHVKDLHSQNKPKFVCLVCSRVFTSKVFLSKHQQR